MSAVRPGLADVDGVLYAWTLCLPCYRLHLRAAPCLDAKERRLASDFGCYWDRGWAYLSYGIGCRPDWRGPARAVIHEMRRREYSEELSLSRT